MKALVLNSDHAAGNAITEELRPIGSLEVENAETLELLKNSNLYATADVLILCVDRPEGGDEGTSQDILRILSFLERETPRVLILLLFQEPPDCESMNRLVDLSRPLDLPREGRTFSTINIFSTTNTALILKLLGEFSLSVSQVEAVEINMGTSPISVQTGHVRLLKIFASRFRGASLHLSPVDGGMSASDVFRLKITDGQGAERFHAIAKLGHADSIHQESRRFTEEVTRLGPKAYAPQVGVIESGTDASAGVFYRLLSDGYRPLMELLLEDDGAAAKAVDRLRESFDPWNQGNPERREKIRDVRRRLVNDEKLTQILKDNEQNFDLNWIYEFEEKNIIVRFACIHGDLHGGNVFVDNDCNPIIIDFGDVGEGPVALDPITLELAIFTHPSISKAIKWHPSLDQHPWTNLQGYILDSPYSLFITACRNWAHSKNGDRAVQACAYSYLLRQLGYNDVDKDLIFNLLDSVRNTLEKAP